MHFLAQRIGNSEHTLIVVLEEPARSGSEESLALNDD